MHHPIQNVPFLLFVNKLTKKINNETGYQKVMAKIDGLMAKGSDKVSKEELAEIRALAQSAQAYEQARYAIEPPATLIGRLEMRMFQRKLKQHDLAQILNVSDAKLSLIMNGKQKPGVEFLKAVHTRLNIDADFILEHV